MMTFIAVIHIIVALVLIVLVLMQDSKSDGALGIGGSSNSNSILGATGAQSLAAKMTVWISVVFALTCMTLTYYAASNNKSVVDSLPVTGPVVPASAPQTAMPQDGAAPQDPNKPASPVTANPEARPEGQAPTTAPAPEKK